MQILKSIIIEDEKESQSILINLLQTYCPSIQVIGVFEDVISSVEFIKRNEIQLVFLDIELQGESGFNLLKYFLNPKFKIIFTTAYNQYAVKAFKFSAIDYLLKPIDIIELTEAVAKVQKLEEAHKMDEVYKILIQNIQNGSNRIAITHQSGFDLLDISEILWLEAEINYTKIHLKSGGKITVAKTLKHFEDYLDPGQFFRISRSAIVNIKFITKFHKQNSLSVTMLDRTVIPVSETRKDELLSLYQRI